MDAKGKKKMNSQGRVKILKTAKRVIVGREIVLSDYSFIVILVIKEIYNDESK